MKRHYFVSQSLTEIIRIERSLEAAGIPENQIHALSRNESQLEIHHLHPVADFMKTDVIRRGLQGLGIGLLIALAVLGVVSVMGWNQPAGWTPFIFLAIVALGFSVWEGGFLGFQEQNKQFSRFQKDLDEDKHILFVDVSVDQETILLDVLEDYPGMLPAGSGESAPEWIISGQRNLKRFVHWAP